MKMVRADRTKSLDGVLGRLFKETVRFEVSGKMFLAVPQVDWCGAEADQSDVRLLHHHVAGHLRVGARRYVVFAADFEQEASVDGASIAEILTRRELQVALLIAEGKGDKAIARHLGISEHTVREHLRRACGKLNISKRSALVAWIMRNTPYASAKSRSDGGVDGGWRW